MREGEHDDAWLGPRLLPRVHEPVEEGVARVRRALALGGTAGPASGTWRTSAPANSGPQMWIGYDGEGTSAVSPGPTSTHMRCEKPSLAPMVVTTSVSGSSSTANVRRYRSVMALRSLGMPREAE